MTDNEGSLCGAFEYAPSGGWRPYRCTEPYGHTGVHRATVDGEVVGEWALDPPVHPMASPLTLEQYGPLLDHLVTCVRPLLLLPLDELAAANEQMKTVVPFLVSPLTYNAGAQNLADQRRLIDAARALQSVVRSFKPGSTDG